MQRTRYYQYDAQQLSCLFSTRKWFGLSVSERLDACQEVENSLAASRGMPPRQVGMHPLLGGTSGYQRGDWIVLNQWLVEDGVFRVEDSNRQGLREVPFPASNWEVLDTVFHEDMHGLQSDLGLAQTGQSYITSDESPELYRIQQDEMQAFATGQQRTLASMAVVEAAQGEQDAGRRIYELRVNDNTYEEALAEAKEKFADEHIDQTLAQVIRDRENGIAPDHPSESYQRVLSVYCSERQNSAVATHTDGPSIDWLDNLQQMRPPQPAAPSGANQDKEQTLGYSLG